MLLFFMIGGRIEVPGRFLVVMKRVKLFRFTIASRLSGRLAKKSGFGQNTFG